jgi:hypothetical protein
MEGDMDGNMKCGPENCPLTAWSALSPSERKVQRQALAEQLYKQGFTMEAIAEQFGVTHQTITNDLRNLQIDCKLNHAKTKSNPKGAGRPKGSTKRHDVAASARAAKRVIDDGITIEQAKAEENLASVTTVKTAIQREEGRREALADPIIDRSELSLTAQQKLDSALRQHRAALDASFRAEVMKEVKKRIDEIVLPSWQEKVDEAQQLYARRRGLMDKETFNIIRRALHPDSRHSISDKKLGEAFDTFMGLEKYLLDEKASPTDMPDIPGSLAEWDAAKRRATEQRRKGRGHAAVPARR